MNDSAQSNRWSPSTRLAVRGWLDQPQPVRDSMRSRAESEPETITLRVVRSARDRERTLGRRQSRAARLAEVLA